MKIARVATAIGVRYARIDGDRAMLLGVPSGIATPDAISGGYLAPGSETGDQMLINSKDLLAPIDRPGKIVAIGLNYREHAAESDLSVPAEPLIFAKFPSSIVGPGAAITWDPTLTRYVDYEAELAVVIGRRARRVSERNALEYVFGYTCLNDVSARDLQASDGQWVRAKSLDSFTPIGPWLVTPDDIGDPQALTIKCSVSGELRQEASTSEMVLPVAALISRLSRSFTLEPGDVIATGTPPGVGWFRTPRQTLSDGDTVTVSIQAIGELVNPVRTRRSTSRTGTTP